MTKGKKWQDMTEGFAGAQMQKCWGQRAITGHMAEDLTTARRLAMWRLSSRAPSDEVAPLYLTILPPLTFWFTPSPAYYSSPLSRMSESMTARALHCWMLHTQCLERSLIYIVATPECVKEVRRESICRENFLFRLNQTRWRLAKFELKKFMLFIF